MLYSPDCSASNSSHEVSATPTHLCNERESESSNSGVPQPGIYSGVRMVGNEPITLKWQGYSDIRCEGSDSNRSIKKRLGAFCQNKTIGGQWTYHESNFHINVLELMAIKLALLTYVKIFELKRVHFQVDNITALTYLVKMGEPKEMVAIAKDIFAISREIMITAEYLTGRLNVKADQASRHFQDSSEWLLSPQMFRGICRKLGIPAVDLFASRACQLHCT